MILIVLTADDADNVRGLTILGHALAPRPLSDGRFALGKSVLTDPAHLEIRSFLTGLPLVDVAENEWETNPVQIDKHDFKHNWKVGEKVKLKDK